MALEDLNCLDALRNCGLLKLFLTPGLRAQPELLQYLISLWDIGQEVFVIHDQELGLETSNIYFITGLSRRVEPVQLYGGRSIGASVNMLLAQHCLGARKSTNGKIDIMTINELVLKVILLTINSVAGDQALHESKKSCFQYVMDYLAPTVFKWAKAMKVNMK